MTVLDDLFPVMFQMMDKMKVGKFNMTNPGLISHNEILEMYRDIIDPSFTWKNFNITEQDQIIKSKRSNNFLDTTKIEAEKFPQWKPIKDSVREVIHHIKDNMEKEKDSQK